MLHPAAAVLFGDRPSTCLLDRRRAFELAQSTAYLFAGVLPHTGVNM